MNSKLLRLVFFGFLLITESLIAQNEMHTDTFSFVFKGNRLDGIINLPISKEPRGIIVLIHGDGKTNVIERNWYSEMRSQFVQLGFTCCVWDKVGCGKSEGKYKQQSVIYSANEALFAIKELERRNIPGANRIGLWGISRAGWICPLIIHKYPSIAFWISVSGTDDKESFSYLLQENLRIDGRSEEEVEQLTDEWIWGTKVFLTGGSASEYLSLTKKLRKDKFYCENYGPCSGLIIRLAYRTVQKKYKNETHVFDPESGLKIYVNDFEKILSGIDCPVLAIFGEKDTNVDWQKTMALYKKTIGKTPDSKLTIKSFPDGDHGINKSITGAINEKIERVKCDGYYELMVEWIKELGYDKL